ncbi:hypothetical protein [Polaribacter glomeratus]|uniref:Uncharacterized protein n=1 Tax=Polaribacter glomeratus TaxID=102 RepID=A0A2S7WYQ2_9FLAO|nr:hypothetical protein [Polaribacter glomeratus]PQJ82699.1 hypothetical protein BTO16_08975 [Polaribacter glomeratus]TXD63726.1 hypothetical protein ESX12_17110 [Polaribacter glomeratus]
MEHLFEKENYNSLDKKYTKSLLIIADRLLCEMYRFKVDRLADDSLVKYIDFFIYEVKKIEMLGKANPRFLWQDFQDTIDFWYKKDKNITAAELIICWDDTKDYNPIKIHINI